MYATFAALTQSPIPAGAAEDSYNVLPSFFGKEVPDNKKVVRIFHGGTGTYVIRQGDWKLISGTKSSAIIKTGNTVSDKPDQLYNLMDDPYEKNNVQQGFADKVKELNHLLDEYIAGKRNARINN